MNSGIYKKINEIMKKVEFVAKDGKLGYGNNTFSIVSHDKILSATRSFFVEFGVIIVPSQVEKGVSIEGTTKNGAKKIRMEALYDVSFIDIEDGSKITIRSEAHAEDNSDKASNKCLTYAVKNSILKILSLQTGDDLNQEQVNKIDTKQRSLILGLINSTNTDLVEFNKAFKIETLNDMPQGNYQQAIDQLQKKQKRIKNANK